jgi:glycosyltransferase involved in cell wall biosynthesis
MQVAVQSGLTSNRESTERVPLISIVIPAYNVAPYLEACLTSALREVDAARALGKADFEVVVVDDCSSDATGALARDLLGGRKDARVAAHEKNRGPAAARNTGVDVSRGDYILFLDSDNTLLEDALPCVVNALFEHVNADVMILGMDMIDVHGMRTGAFYGGYVPADPLDRLRNDPFLLFETNIMDTFCVVRASIARSARYDESLSQVSDWDFWIRLHYEHGSRFAMLERPVGGYRVRPGQLTEVNAAQPKECAREMLRIFGKALAMAIRLDLPVPAVQRLIASVQRAGATYCQG